MGKSAKFLKRPHKKPKSGRINQVASASKTTEADIQNAKKKATLKTKASKAKATTSGSTKRSAEDKLLGGADYVTLLMGGRRKAKEEAAKLPRDKDDDAGDLAMEDVDDASL